MGRGVCVCYLFVVCTNLLMCLGDPIRRHKFLHKLCESCVPSVCESLLIIIVLLMGIGVTGLCEEQPFP